jgi:hypothetical protein
MWRALVLGSLVCALTAGAANALPTTAGGNPDSMAVDQLEHSLHILMWTNSLRFLALSGGEFTRKAMEQAFDVKLVESAVSEDGADISYRAVDPIGRLYALNFEQRRESGGFGVGWIADPQNPRPSRILPTGAPCISRQSVETELRAAGWAEGFFFLRPVPHAEFTKSTSWIDVSFTAGSSCLTSVMGLWKKQQL